LSGSRRGKTLWMDVAVISLLGTALFAIVGMVSKQLSDLRADLRPFCNENRR
jgi:hypothetical protein